MATVIEELFDLNGYELVFLINLLQGYPCLIIVRKGSGQEFSSDGIKDVGLQCQSLFLNDPVG